MLPNSNATNDFQEIRANGGNGFGKGFGGSGGRIIINFMDSDADEVSIVPLASAKGGVLV